MGILVRLTDLAPGDDDAFVRIYHPTAETQVKATPIRPATWSAAGAPLGAGETALFLVRAYVGETARRYVDLDRLRELLRGNRDVLRSKLPEKAGAIAELTRLIDGLTRRLAEILDSPSLSSRLNVAAVTDSSVRFWGGGTMRLVAVSSESQTEMLGRLSSKPALIEVRVEDADTGQTVAGVPLGHEITSGEGRFESAPDLDWTTNRSGGGGAYFVPRTESATIRVSLPGDPDKSVTYTVTGVEARLAWADAPLKALGQPAKSALALGVIVHDIHGAPLLNETVRFRVVDAAGEPISTPERTAVFMTSEETTLATPVAGAAGTTLVIAPGAPIGKFYVEAYLPRLPSSTDPTRPVSIVRPITVLAIDSQEEEVISGQAQRARGGQPTAEPLVARYIDKPPRDPATDAPIWPKLRFTIRIGGGTLSAPGGSGPSVEVQIEGENARNVRVFYTPGSPHHHPALISVETEHGLPQPLGVAQPPGGEVGFVGATGTVYFTTRPARVSLVRPVFLRDEDGLYLRDAQSGQPLEEGASEKQEHERPAEAVGLVGKPDFVYQVDVLGPGGTAVEPDHKGKVMVEIRVPALGSPPEKVLVRSLDFAHRLVPSGIGAAPIKIDVKLLSDAVRFEGDTAVYRTEPFIVTGDLLADAADLVRKTPDAGYKVIFAPHQGFIQIGYAASPERWLEQHKVVARMVVILAIDGLGAKSWNEYLRSNHDSSFRRYFSGAKSRKGSAVSGDRNEAVFPSVTSVNWASIFTGNQPAELGIAGNEFVARDEGLQGGKAWRHVSFTGGSIVKSMTVTVGPKGSPASIIMPGDLGRAYRDEGFVRGLLGTKARTVYEDLGRAAGMAGKLPRWLTRKRALVTNSIYTSGISRPSEWLDTTGTLDVEAIYLERTGQDVGPRLDRLATDWLTHRLKVPTYNWDLPELLTLYLFGLDHQLHEGTGPVERQTVEYLTKNIAVYFEDLRRTLSHRFMLDHTVFVLCSDHGHTRGMTAPEKQIRFEQIKTALGGMQVGVKPTLVEGTGDTVVNQKSGQITAPDPTGTYAFSCHNGPVGMIYLGVEKLGNAGFKGANLRTDGRQRDRRFDLAASLLRNLGDMIDRDLILMWESDAGDPYRVVTDPVRGSTSKAGEWLRKSQKKRDIDPDTAAIRLNALNPRNAGDLILHSLWDESVALGKRTQFAARTIAGGWEAYASNHGGLQRADSDTPLVVWFPVLWPPALGPRTKLQTEVVKLLRVARTSNADVARIVRMLQKLPLKR